jgi:Ca2+:H+ antiporter
MLRNDTTPEATPRGPESAPLLVGEEENGELHPLQSSSWAEKLRYIWHVVVVSMCCSYDMVLIVVVPAAIVAGAQGWDPSAVFILNFIAILPLASLLSFSTDELAKSVGQTVGGLVNATFGNAVEMIVSSLNNRKKGPMHAFVILRWY